MKGATVFSLILVCELMARSTAAASATLVGRWRETDSDARDVEVVGDTVFLADGTSGLKILQAGQSTQPVKVGSFVNGNAISAVAVSGNRALVLDGNLQILDISSLSNPVRIGGMHRTNFFHGINMDDAAWMGDRAIVSVEGYGIVRLNLTDPAAPIEEGRLSFAGIGSAPILYDRVAVAENLVFYTAKPNVSIPGLKVDSFSYYPGLTGWSDNGSPAAVAVSAGFAYVGNYINGFQVLDARTPTQIQLVGGIPNLGDIRDVVVSRATAALAAGTNGIHFIDISDPLHPALLGSRATGGLALRTALQGQKAYIAEGTNGLEIVSFAPLAPPAPRLLGGWRATNSNTRDVEVIGKIAYLADGAAGLNILSVSNPAAPILLGNFSITNAASVSVSGSLALVATGGGVHILDVSDPAHPASVGQAIAENFLPPAAATYIADAVWYGTNALFSISRRGVELANMSNPASPQGMGLVTWPGDISVYYDKLTVEGGLFFSLQANGSSGSLRMGSGLQPTSILGTADWFSGVALSGGLLVASHFSDALEIYNLSNLTQTGRLARLHLGDGVHLQDVAIAGNFAVAAGAESGVHIVDIGAVTEPILRATFNTAGRAQKITLQGQMAYVADSTNGLVILDLSDFLGPSLRVARALEGAPALEIHEAVGHTIEVEASNELPFSANPARVGAAVTISQEATTLIDPSASTPGSAARFYRVRRF